MYGNKMFECTEPVDKQYTFWFVETDYSGVNPPIHRSFTEKSLAAAAARYYEAFNAQELRRRDFLIANGYLALWTQMSYVDGSCNENGFYGSNGPSDLPSQGWWDVLPDYYRGEGTNAGCLEQGTWYRSDGTSGPTPLNSIGSSVSNHVLCHKTPGEYLIGTNQSYGPYKCLVPVKKPQTCQAGIPDWFGNPISAKSAVKTHVEASTAVSGNLAAFINLRYSYPATAVVSNVGWYWQPEYFRELRVYDATEPGVTAPRVVANRNSEMSIFLSSGTGWTAQSDITDRLTEVKDLQGTRLGWRYYDSATENVEQYDAVGSLQSLTTRAGVVLSLTYNASRQLTSVSDSFGRTVAFTYFPPNAARGAGNRATVTEPGGAVISYAYDAANNLASVTYPDGNKTTYLYGELSNTGGKLNNNALTGILDSNGVRFANFTYGDYSLPLSTEYAGGVQKYSFSYSFWGSAPTQTTVSDPLGTQRTYTYQTVLGTQKTGGATQPCPSCGGSSTSSATFDANGNVSSSSDFNGKKTCYAYDLSRNLETARVEGLTAADDCATALAMTQAQLATTFARSDVRKVSTTWHATYRLPATMSEPAAGTTVGGAPGSKSTVFTYDASGNLTQKDVTAPRNDGSSTNETRTWKWTYNTLGQVLTAKDPLNNTATTVYYTATDTAVPPKYTKGDVQTVTNAASHVTTFNEYDKNGRLTKLTDPNGLVTTMTYHARGWLTARSVNNGASTETTSYTYDKVGQLTRVTLPDGSTLYYAYDDAHRLVGMSDQVTGTTVAGDGSLRVKLANLAGNKIIYTLDNMGNRTAEANYDPSGTVKRSKSRVIDALNRLQQDIGGTTYAVAPTQAITQYGYDNNGNLTTTTDPLGRVTNNNYDALNRLVSVIDPYNGTTKPTLYSYNAAGQLETVTDPQGLTTSYTYNGHADLVKQTSPDTGATQFKYNAAGNVVAKIDAANRCAITAYDNLNRISTVKFYAASNTSTNTAAKCFGTIAGTVAVEETVSYSYDSTTASEGGAGGVGRLTKFTDGSGSTAYVYDKNGRVLSKTQTVAGAANPTQSVAYAYNSAGQLVSLVTPSGQTVAYSYGAVASNAPGKLVGITVNGVDVVKGAVYEPFGPNGGWSWGNHGTLINGNAVNQHLRVFDRDFRPVVIASDPQGFSRSLTWDAANRILQQSDGALVNPNPALSQTYGYDGLDRLNSFTPGAGSTLSPQQFSYDAIGNRQSLMLAAAGTASTAANTQTYSYSPSSHWLQGISGQSTKAFSYDATGNLTLETGISSLAYTLDAKNRVRKVQVGANTADTVTYSINALGQRVRKLAGGAQATGTTTASATATSKTARFIYDERGRLLGEYDDSGRLLQETVWFDDLPVTTLRPKGSHAGNAAGVPGGE